MEGLRDRARPLAAGTRSELAAVKGIGLSGHMHGATLLDAADKPLRPCILWNDVRSAEEARGDRRRRPSFARITGNIVLPGFTAPKLVWVEQHEPEIFAKVAKVLLPKDYVRLQLTGDYASDMSDSAGTLLARHRASATGRDELLAATGLAATQMPKLFEGTEATGTLRRELASALGHDGAAGRSPAAAATMPPRPAASARSSRAPASSRSAPRACSSSPTTAIAPNPASAVHAFCHAVPDTWHQMGVILSAAGALEWLAGVLGQPPPS